MPSKFPREVRRSEMSVPPQHREGFVTGDSSDLHRVEALLERATRRLMPKIVKPEIVELGAVNCPTERILHGFCSKRKNTIVEGARQRGQRRGNPSGRLQAS